jgi:hypothetical protein
MLMMAGAASDDRIRWRFTPGPKVNMQRLRQLFET